MRLAVISFFASMGVQDFINHSQIPNAPHDGMPDLSAPVINILVTAITTVAVIFIKEGFAYLKLRLKKA